MVGQIPLGNWLAEKIIPGDSYFSDISEWILYVPNMAAQRAMYIGIALGVIHVSLKIVLGIDKHYMGRD